MSSESLQHFIGRNRPPRVQITYDVETEGAMVAVELPFVVGVMADLSAQGNSALPELKERKFAYIDKDNFNSVLAGAAPRLAFTVQNRITNEDTKLNVELNFKHLDDFEPARVAEQVESMRELLEMRKSLKELLGKMEGKDKFVKLLEVILTNPDKRAEAAKQLGIDIPTSEKAAPPTEESK